MSVSSSPVFSRRNLLIAGGGLAGLAALGGTTAWGTGQAWAADAEGGYFDLTVPSDPFLREKPVHNSTVLQSFCFDNDNGHIYTLQTMQGGIQLPGEPGPIDWPTRSKQGSLCLTRLDAAGAITGHMYLKGFGHGIACGVDPDGTDAYLWTETDSNPDSGYGRAITRFKFVDKGFIDFAAGELEVHYLKPGSTSNQPSIDVLNRRLLLRYIDHSSTNEDKTFYALYDLDAVMSGNYEPIYDVPRVGIEKGEWFQGFVLFGDFVYQMTGQPYSDEGGDNPPSGRGNCHVSSIDLRTGDLVERFRTEAAYSLPFREPEGMAVQLTQPRRLYMGFAGGHGPRNISLYYKEQKA